MPATKRKLYQCRVRFRDHTVHESETSDEKSARARVRRTTLAAEPGAIGTLYRVDRKHKDALVPIYEVRCVYEGDTGKPGLVVEDHTTPPPTHEEPHDV